MIYHLKSRIVANSISAEKWGRCLAGTPKADRKQPNQTKQIWSPGSATETTVKDAPTDQFGLRYLFFVMTSVAVGACFWGQPEFHPTVRATGLSIVLYWISKAFFVGSTRLPRIGREVVFLLGLPCYVASVLIMLGGIIWLVMSLLGRT